MNLYTWVCFQLLFLVLDLLSFVGQRLYLIRVLDTTSQSSILFQDNLKFSCAVGKAALSTWLQLMFPHCAYNI